MFERMKHEFISDAVEGAFRQLDSWGMDRQARSNVGAIFGITTGDDAMKVRNYSTTNARPDVGRVTSPGFENVSFIWISTQAVCLGVLFFLAIEHLSP